MSTDIAHRPTTGDLALSPDQTEWTEKQRYALGLGQNVTGADLAIYLHVCQRTGLDPFARQIYMIERWTKDGPRQTIQTGIDGYRLIARRATDAARGALAYAAMEWCGADGAWRDVWLSPEAPAAARCVVLRDGQPYPAVALYREYVQTYKDKSSGQTVPTAMWKDKAAGQLQKCAEALALRKAFPLDLSGIYVEEEMQQADNRQPDPKQGARPRGLDAVRAAAGAPVPVEPETVVATVEAERPGDVDGGDPISDRTRRKMFALLAKVDPDADDDTQRKGMSLVLGREITSRADLTEDDAHAVIAALQAELDRRDAAQTGGE